MREANTVRNRIHPYQLHIFPGKAERPQRLPFSQRLRAVEHQCQ